MPVERRREGRPQKWNIDGIISIDYNISYIYINLIFITHYTNPLYLILRFYFSLH